LAVFRENAGRDDWQTASKLIAESQLAEDEYKNKKSYTRDIHRN